MTAKNSKRPSVTGDRYYTPKWAVKQCFEHILIPHWGNGRAPGYILDPGAGRGEFTRWARFYFPESRILAVDNDPTVGPWSDASESLCGDYLAPETARWVRSLREGGLDLIVGNPPFTFALDFIQRSLELATTVTFLLRQGFLSSAERARFFREHKPASVHILANRPKFTNPEYEVSSTDTADYCYVTWSVGHAGPTELYWLPEVPALERK